MHPKGFVLRRALAALSSTLVLLWAGGAGTSAAAPRSVHPALSAPIDPALGIHQRFLSRDAHGSPMVDLFIEGDVRPGILRTRGIEVNTVAGRLVTARCPLGLLSALLTIPGIERMEIAERCEPYLEESALDVGLPSVRTVPPPDFTGQTGAGVLVGVVDGGLDLAHADFKNPDGTTRLVSLWDQTVAGTPPAGFSYGTEWSQAQINAGLSTETDTGAHGTHVLGIAAGDGSATGNGVPAFTYVGVAPKADLCFVKTTFLTTNIVDGVNYIFQRAAALGKQAVVNLSLGTQDGPHDGTYDFDTMISALTGPGRIVVASAGNRQTDDIHGQVTVGGSTQTMTLAVPNYVRNPGAGNDFLVFSGWYEGGDQISVTIVTPGADVLGPVVTGASGGFNTQDGFVNIFNATTAPANNDHEIYIEIFDQFANRIPRQGTWQFQFAPISITSTGQVDMYTYGNGLGNGASFVPWVQGLFVGGVVGSPGSADSVIAVAAHTTKDCWDSIDGFSYCWNPLPATGDIAFFSSWGPLRDGRIRPDLSAPGFGVASARSASASVDLPFVVPDGVHMVEAGTSMSAPHVTGAAGLLLAQPGWAGSGPSQVRTRLQQTARTDGFTGPVPNVTWGAGKLDVASALAPVVTAAIPYPLKGQVVPLGTYDSVLVVVSAAAAADSIAIDLSLDGGGSYPHRLGVLTSVAPNIPASLLYFAEPGFATTQAKLRSLAYASAWGTATGSSDSLFLIQIPTGVETVASAAAPRFGLSPNAPNPFNPVTTIAFGTEKAGRVTLRVYNAHGALVRTLVDEPLPAGHHRARWDGRNDRGKVLASGVYLYELAAGGKQVTRKMSLLK